MLDRMARLQDRMEEVDKLSYPSSVAELVRSVNQALNADDPYYNLNRPQAVAQELLLSRCKGKRTDTMVVMISRKRLWRGTLPFN